MSLDYARGGAISRRLAQLYDYMQRRLRDANMQQSDEPLAEVLGLLATLSEAWEGIRSSAKATPVMESPWAPRPVLESGSAHGWSF